jgi:predicted dinucleotide-binding enzyme
LAILPIHTHSPGNSHVAINQPNHRRSAGVVFKSDSGTRVYSDAGEFKDHRPLRRVIDAFASVGGVVLIPCASDGLGEIDFRVRSDDQGAIRAIGTRNDDVGAEPGDGGHHAEADEDEVRFFHGNKI